MTGANAPKGELMSFRFKKRIVGSGDDLKIKELKFYIMSGTGAYLPKQKQIICKECVIIKINKLSYLYHMINLREDILKNQITYYNGLIAKHQQNVDIYLNQPVGIGEHSDVMSAIETEITAIAQAHEKIEVINHYFLNRQ